MSWCYERVWCTAEALIGIRILLSCGSNRSTCGTYMYNSGALEIIKVVPVTGIWALVHATMNESAASYLPYG